MNVEEDGQARTLNTKNKRRGIRGVDRYYTAKEAQRYLGITDKTLTKLAREHDPPIVPQRFGDKRYIRYSEEQLQQIIAMRQYQLAPPRATLTTMADDIRALRQEVENLREDVERLRPASGGSPPAPTIRSATHRGKALSGDPPAGLVTLEDFATLHAVEAGRAWQGLTSGKSGLLDQRLRTRFYERWHTAQGFVRCPECPQTEGEPHA